VARRRLLRQAPIHEALIDVQFAPPREVDFESVARELMGKRAGTIVDLWEGLVEVHFEPKEQPKARSRSGFVGKRVEFTDSRQVLQLRPGGFTFSQLPQYESWERMRSCAEGFWSEFYERVKPETIKRTAVRYINRLSLPLPINDFDEYFVVGPRVPDSLPQTVTGYLARIATPKGDDTMVVTQSIQGTDPEKNALTFLFDIDVFCQLEYPAADTETLWSTLERQRALKNDVFFEYLTEKTVEMYE
jgi:uncharacterized protein (TIGR04255 family)